MNTEQEFHITDEASALWLLRKLANIEAEQRRVKRQAEALLNSLQSEAESLKHLYMGELEQWTREELSKRGNRRKSLHTLQGTLRFRHVEASLSLEDPTEALHHALSQEWEECRVSKWELNREAYLKQAEKHLQENDELLAGVRYTPEREAFSLTLNAPEKN